jgi:2-methylcitrate dehydratase PrpD
MISSKSGETMPSKMLCEQMAEYVVSLRFEAIPPEVIAKAKSVFLHNLAISFGGIGTDQVIKALELVERREGPATIIGQQFRASAADAAFVNTIAMRALRMEDTAVPSFTHPGACVVPAALALGEQEQRSGREVLTAVIAGYDVIGKLGSMYTWKYVDRTPSHVWVALGVAAAAARLMQLDVEQTTGALAHACNLAVLIASGIQDFQYGNITRNGMFAAMLGRCRAPFPADALEGTGGLYAMQLGGTRPTTEQIMGSLGSHYEIMSTVLKPHPCTGCNLVPTEIFRHAVRRHGLANEDIRRIRVSRHKAVGSRSSQHSRGPFEGYQGGMYGATSSLPFALATLLVHGELKLEHFRNPNEARTAATMQKVTVEFRDDIGLLDHEVAIETSAGKWIEERGAAEYLPVPNATAILEEHARRVLGAAKVAGLERCVMTLDSTADLRQLTTCLA